MQILLLKDKFKDKRRKTMNKNIMEYETVDLDDNDGCVVIIDQTKLPGTTEIIRFNPRINMLRLPNNFLFSSSLFCL